MNLFLGFFSFGNGYFHWVIRPTSPDMKVRYRSVSTATLVWGTLRRPSRCQMYIATTGEL